MHVSNFSIHGRALCESTLVGAGTRVMAFAHIARDAQLGRDCEIGEHAVVGEGVVLGDRVVVQAGVRLAPGVRLEDGVTVGANATFAHGATPALVRAGAVVGAGATILAGVTVGPHARISEGAVVTRAVPPNAIVSGHPAQIVGYVEAAGRVGQEPAAGETGVRATRVAGVTLHRMREVEDLRGNLSVGELGRDVPFDVKRYFLVYDVPNMEIRGEHAHLQCHQFLIAVKGSIHVVADDGRNREEIVLDRPSLGLHLPPMTWGIQYRYSPDAVLLVLASHHYDAADYVRDHDQFLALVAARAAP
jgi:UDP-2-acetamido-3-amino-2,3-dideoxy-glucuronate N-acetyltransferase